MKKNFFTFHKLLFIFFFTLFFIMPIIIQYQNTGVYIKADNFFYTDNKIETFDDLKFFINVTFFKSLNVLKNNIFIFFIAGALFQTIMKIIKKIK